MSVWGRRWARSASVPRKRLERRFEFVQHQLHHHDVYNLDYKVERVLSGLSRGFGEGLGKASQGFLPCAFPLRLNRPPLTVLAVVTLVVIVVVDRLRGERGASF